MATLTPMKIRRVDFSPDEWLAGTFELNLEESGMLIAVCALNWSRRGAVSLDLICGKLRQHRKQTIKTLLERLCKLGKLEVKDGLYSSKRALDELEKANSRTVQAQQNGALGGRPASKNNGLAKPDGSRKRKANHHHQLPTINDQEESPHNPPKGSFAAWWKSYPHKVGKRAAEAAYKRAQSRATPDQMLAGLQAYIQSKPADRPWCNPATFLNQDRWHDQPALALTEPAALSDDDRIARIVAKIGPLPEQPPPAQARMTRLEWALACFHLSYGIRWDEDSAGCPAPVLQQYVKETE